MVANLPLSVQNAFLFIKQCNRLCHHYILMHYNHIFDFKLTAVFFWTYTILETRLQPVYTKVSMIHLNLYHTYKSNVSEPEPDQYKILINALLDPDTYSEYGHASSLVYTFGLNFISFNNFQICLTH